MVEQLKALLGLARRARHHSMGVDMLDKGYRQIADSRISWGLCQERRQK